MKKISVREFLFSNKGKLRHELPVVLTRFNVPFAIVIPIDEPAKNYDEILDNFYGRKRGER